MTKQEIKELGKSAALLKAVGHPMRLAILEIIREEKKCTVTLIHKSLKMEQAIASQHLAILKKHGVVKCERDGKNMHYSISNKNLLKAIDQVRACVVG